MKMANTKLIFALDVKNLKTAEKFLKMFKGLIYYYKIGSSLFTLEGPKSVELVHKYGGHVFLDLKFHDIPNTVQNAVLSSAKLGVYSVSVHISGGTEMLKQCVALIKRPKIWGITVLTSLKQKDFSAIGFKHQINSVVNNFTEMAISAGIDGIVCSGLEAGKIKKRFGKKLEIIVPGIRLSGEKHDQKRTVTPGDAAMLGADFIVVGRPILTSHDPVATTQFILEELDAVKRKI